MIPLREVNVLGVFVTPALPCVIAALVLSVLVRRLLDLTNVDHYVWNRALFNVSVLICIAALLVLSLRWGG